ncbi:GPI ethanolamine phosphate transferase 1 [Rhynchospora pubera]|uniref:GPI ethanolamine phosphate transferase 1 n=1 Tax=Rhynchospora pubera TaxID=906938 RepID=A0AAV8DE08_9POAL|nr:GPI ethanolamine phosphate transferase 1 [Rhynchospora pubera]
MEKMSAWRGGGGGRRRGTRREAWLVAVGVALHAVYMLSIFDIYFKTPLVRGMDLVYPSFSSHGHPPAKRLVLLVADGLRADKFFEFQASSSEDQDGPPPPFLRHVIRHLGRWGVSHARPPTESRPGHVSIIAGFYEDPSAVTKGWKSNPVEFDSVFNRSRHTISFGSPDIVPIFCSSLPHGRATWASYPHHFEDFATDASFLDHWSLDQFKSLLKASLTDPHTKRLLHQDQLVVFLHLLGCDTNGHAHRPYSPIYLNNVKVVDSIARDVYHLMETYFNDSRTAYIFTADHGMSDKGSHGDGHPSNTDTPLVAWGAGINFPKYLTFSQQSQHDADAFRFVDDHKHGPTPQEWDLHDVERLDVNQADIAPLMATLLGLPCPVNSVGSLPKEYLNLNKEEEAQAVLANTKQILNQFLRKSQLKQQSSLYFKPFKPLENYHSILQEIEDSILARNFGTAIRLSETLRELALSGFHYFQTYDWHMLMTVITLGYLGWMINLIIHVVESYTSFPTNLITKKSGVPGSSKAVYFGGCLLAGLLSFLLLLEKSPPLYHAYFLMTTFLWTQIMCNFQFLKAFCGELTKKSFMSHFKLLVTSCVAIFVLEFLVMSFTDRKLYTWCFLFVGLLGPVLLLYFIPGNYFLAVFVCLASWFLSGFTLMPAEIPEKNNLVVLSGALIVAIALAARWIDINKRSDKFWVYLSKDTKKGSTFSMLFFVQISLVVLSSAMVWISTSHRAQKRQLLPLHQLINWSLSGTSIVLPLRSQSSVLSRLTSIFLGFAPPFLLLSIGYEAVFYGAFALVLAGWILVESAFNYSKEKGSSSRLGTLVGDTDERYLELSDLRIPLIFMVLFNVAFFGTGNFASIASFEISSVYRFITIFSPFLMSALLIFKLFIPFILVICAFSAITKIIRVPRMGLYFIVIIFSDVMTIHFFFLVRNTGSWMEIGNSISHFGIMSAQVVFVLMLFAITNVYTKDIQIATRHFSNKAL